MAAFRDELEKIAVSKARLNIVAKDREGTRPISVTNFLKKEKDGTLYKRTGNSTKVAADWAGSPVDVGMGSADPAEARRPRRKGDTPTQDDVNVVSREDGRGNAGTTSGVGESFNNIGAAGNSVGGT